MSIVWLLFRVFWVGLWTLVGGVLGDAAAVVRHFGHTEPEIDATALQQIPAVRLAVDEGGPYIIGECEVIA